MLPQVEHARLAGCLARAWAWGDFQHQAFRQELLAAIYHHDDGWPPWDANPGIDPALLRPWSFDEMPLEHATLLWNDSIARCGALGNLAEYVAGRHFLELLSRSQSADRAMGTVRAAVDDFRRRHELRCARCADNWVAARPTCRRHRDLRLALRWLKFFDALSLWICVAQRARGETIDAPDGSRWMIEPIGTDLRFVPWPFAAPTLSVALSALRVPEGEYHSAEALLSTARASQFCCLMRSSETATSAPGCHGLAACG